MLPVVYTITHVPTGMFYIGCTDNLERRRAEHIRKLKAGSHRNRLLQSNFDDNDSFIWNTIEMDSRRSALDLELNMIQSNACNPLLMNVVGKPLSIEQRLVVSESWTSNMRDEASKRAIDFWTDERKTLKAEATREQKLGTTHSTEAKIKMSQAKKGIPKSDTHKQRLSEACGKRVVIDGITYSSCNVAGKSLGVTQATVGNRCRNPKFTNWQFN